MVHATSVTPGDCARAATAKQVNTSGNALVVTWLPRLHRQHLAHQVALVHLAVGAVLLGTRLRHPHLQARNAVGQTQGGRMSARGVIGAAGRLDRTAAAAAPDLQKTHAAAASMAKGAASCGTSKAAAFDQSMNHKKQTSTKAGFRSIHESF